MGARARSLAMLAVFFAGCTAGWAETTIDDFEDRHHSQGLGGMNLPYRLYVPRDYDPTRSYPIFLFLHGMGGQGVDNTSQIELGALTLADNLKYTANDSFVFAPQMYPGTPYSWSKEGLLPHVLEALDTLRREFHIDDLRMYVTGVSMGGNGTYYAADYYGDYFAAAVPIAGWYSTSRASSFVEMPMWIWHGELDGTVSVTSDRAMYAAISALGGPVLYTEYPYGGHVIWGQVYSEDDLYAWWFAQTLQHEPPRAAGADVVCEVAELGDGKFAYTFQLETDDELLGPYAVTLGVRGVGGVSINQLQFAGTDLNDESLATLADGMGGYVKALDSWAFSPFGSNPTPGVNPYTGAPVNGFYQDSGTYVLSCYSGGGSAMGSGVNLAYIVADGDIEWMGEITRDAKIYSVFGSAEAPAGLAGDYNGDDTVSGADYVIWADTFGNDGSPGKEDLRADGNGDGAVSGADYVIWADNFGATR